MKKPRKIQVENLVSLQDECCGNPWNGECKNTDIVLHIYHEGDHLPICRSCWNEIAETDIEWGDDNAF